MRFFSIPSRIEGLGKHQLVITGFLKHPTERFSGLKLGGIPHDNGKCT